MAASSLELYFVDDTGQRSRVHDARFMDGKAHRVPLGDPRANTRYFVAADGSKRAFTMAKDTDRALTFETMLITSQAPAIGTDADV